MFNEISAKDLNFNSFSMIGDEWMLITAKSGEKTNAMTASWGGMGIMWGKPVAYIFIRPQRYTKELVDSSEKLSLCVLPAKYKKQLTYFGSVSGREEDKINKANFSVLDYDGVPYFAESEKVFITKKLYKQYLSEEYCLDESIKKFYPENDYHEMYVVEIEKILVK